jgi:hypothetical protein
VLAGSGNFVTVEGGQVRSEADFWGQIVHKLDLGRERTRKEAGGSSAATGASLTGKLPFLEAAAKSEHGQVRSSERAISYDVHPQQASLQALLDSHTSLLVDDFHYISQDTQRAIIQALKGAVFSGLGVILLAVPHRAFDPVTVEHEVEGRFKHIEIPPWDPTDLLLIPERGFDALNVKSSTSLNQAICAEGFGNPLLVQEICSELCLKSGIRERTEAPQMIDERILPQALEEIAQSKGFPKYRKLKAGPDARKQRQARAFKDGSSADKYSAILTAIASLGPKPRTSYDELRGALQSLLTSSSLPAKHEITSALVNMSKIAKDKIEGEPPLEWVANEDALVITDPFLLFYMKWAAHHEAPGS